MPMKFELLDGDYSFNVYTINGLEKNISNFNELICWLDNVMENPIKKYNKFRTVRIYKDAILRELHFDYKKRLIFANSFSELEGVIDLNYETPKALVTDNYGRIINVTKLYDIIMKIYRDFPNGNVNNKNVYKLDILGNFKIFDDTDIKHKKITNDIIEKNIKRNEPHFKIFNCNYYYFGYTRHKSVIQFRKDSIPGIHYRAWHKSNRNANVGIKKELAICCDKENKEFTRKKRKSELIYIIGNFYNHRHYYSKMSWKDSSKNNKQWEKRSIKRNVKNSLHPIDGYYVLDKKLGDKEYYDQMLKFVINNLGTIEERFERMEKNYD